MAYATIADLEERYPDELVLLAADGATGLRDDDRITAALDDASIEVKSILQARYSAAELALLDADGLAIVKVYTMDIALFRIAISFSRLTDDIRERYKSALKRLEAIAAGKGALTFTGGGTPDPNDASSQNAVLVSAPERVFTRARQGGLP
ncbi:Mu-like prophage protein gp36 [Hartmannibacter diazotrophicus]|uniref:Mu-like prophage protein gp36 n=1 Tax=Hartmannibacter diazotrophicus TaxID=1482074 RepID=A0A2C9D6E0_9HYPH|nr:phage protein Gp36 family protein [Hartmannibacter diazotrophicus]SON55813.1 Mu-like prophage protein gp36 [Hartmannibacter diazotrophicus]